MTDKEFVFQTTGHIRTLGFFISRVIHALMARIVTHDRTKLEDPEYDIFKEYTPKLRGSTYGSEEYKEYLKQMDVALQHHYLNNSHHPEHHTEGIRGMDIIDLVEMLCDWKAATMRHADGDIVKSIEQNQKRFGYSDDIKKILLNSVALFDNTKTNNT